MTEHHYAQVRKQLAETRQALTDERKTSAHRAELVDQTRKALKAAEDELAQWRQREADHAATQRINAHQMYRLGELIEVEDRLHEAEAERDLLRGLIEKMPDTHMQFGVIHPDGMTEMRPCADWCWACKLQHATDRGDRYRAAWQSARRRAAELNEELTHAEILMRVNATQAMNREEEAEARIAAARAAVHIADDHDITDWQRGYRACAERAIAALKGELQPLEEM